MSNDSFRLDLFLFSDISSIDMNAINQKSRVPVLFDLLDGTFDFW